MEEHTAEAYVFNVEGNTMYVDLENPGPRNYPGEGEDRKVAFDISGAEVVQTGISDVNPERDNPVRTAVIVSIDYHMVNSEYIADKITTDGQEHFFIVYMSKRKCNCCVREEDRCECYRGRSCGGDTGI